MATETELGECFPDCEVGAVPPLGHVYGIKTLWIRTPVWVERNGSFLKPAITST